MIFATNKLDPSARVLPTPTLVSSCIIIPEPLTVPIPVEYVTWSPVFKLCPGRYIALVWIKTEVKPAPGFENEIVVPIPTPVVVPNPTDSEGSK